MNRTQKFSIGLAMMFVCGLATAALTDLQQAPNTRLTQESPATRPFKLRAAGAIDLTTGGIVFGGVASHLGLYSADGSLNPQDFSILGTIEAANGDTLEFTGAFVIGPLGEIEAALVFTGGTGRFVDASGEATGPVTLDPDFTFLITAIGTLDY